MGQVASQHTLLPTLMLLQTKVPKSFLRAGNPARQSRHMDTQPVASLEMESSLKSTYLQVTHLGLQGFALARQATKSRSEKKRNVWIRVSLTSGTAVSPGDLDGLDSEDHSYGIKDLGIGPAG